MPYDLKQAGVIVGTQYAVIAGPFSPAGDRDVCIVELTNTGGTALSDVKVQMAAADGGTFHDYLGGSDWNTGSSNMLFASSGVATLGAGQSGLLIFRHHGTGIVRILGCVASGQTTVKANARY